MTELRARAALSAAQRLAAIIARKQQAGAPGHCSFDCPQPIRSLHSTKVLTVEDLGSEDGTEEGADEEDEGVTRPSALIREKSYSVSDDGQLKHQALGERRRLSNQGLEPTGSRAGPSGETSPRRC